MKKILLFLLFSIFTFCFSYADDTEEIVEKTEINSIFYDGNINSTSEIKLSGTKLGTCTHLLFNNQVIYFKTTSETSLNFPFSKLNTYN